MENAEEFEKQTALLIQVVLGSTQVHQAEDAKKEATTVQRLTFMATVFIPLSFTTSVFAMNLDVLPTPTELTSFLIAAAITSLTTFVVLPIILSFFLNVYYRWKGLKEKWNLDQV
jgi:Mg2+ and Co2+ transporter CorA